MTMTKDQALSKVIEAAESWSNELSEYIIPASVAADDGADYQPGYNELTEALELLQPPVTMVATHQECGAKLISYTLAGQDKSIDNFCPICETVIEEGEWLTRKSNTLTVQPEFTEKQTKLACFLYELYHGEGTWLTEVLIAPLEADKYDNYMADARDVLREQTHLLTLACGQAMGLVD